MTPGPHLLVVDDEAGIRESLSSILKDEGYRVEAVGSAEEALECAAAGNFEVVLLDVWLPGIDGLEALSRLQASPRPPAVIMISGHGTIETAVRATKLGAFDFIEKPSRLKRSSSWFATPFNSAASKRKTTCCEANWVTATRLSATAFP